MGRAAKATAIAIAIVWATQLFPVAAQQPDAPVRSVDEVRLPGLAIGRSYSTWRLSESPFLVHNPTDDTVRVRVQVVVPARHELRPGARPVPDRTWVALESREFTVSPRAARRTDVRLTLPYDPDLAGHTYQVDVACDERGPGGWVARTRYRLLFTVEMDYRDDTEIDLAAHVARACGAL